MIGFFRNEKGSAAAVEFALVLPSLIILVASTIDFAWLALHELSAQFVATSTVRDINVDPTSSPGGVVDTTRIRNRAANFLLDLDDTEIEICSDVADPTLRDEHGNLCPNGNQPGKNAGGSRSMVIVRIRPEVDTILLHVFYTVFNVTFETEGIAIGRNEAR